VNRDWSKTMDILDVAQRIARNLPATRAELDGFAPSRETSDAAAARNLDGAVKVFETARAAVSAEA